MSATQYEASEARRHVRFIQEITGYPLAERKDNKASYAAALADPALIAERVGWLLDGSYGFGAMLAAQQAAESKGNKAAQLGILLAACEWSCPAREATAAWHSITQEQQANVNAAILRTVAEWQAEQTETA